MIGYLDCSTGVSGDKFLGALLDAGAAGDLFTRDDVQAVLDALAPEALVVVERVRSHGIAATGVRVEATAQPAHRHWRDIRQLIEGAALPAPVRERSLVAFEALAVAEASAHDCAVDDVHFHEVGALDSLLDVVGTCAGMASLGIDSLIASPVAVGSGTVDTSHGLLPVPAPATARLLTGVPVHAGPSAGELTTPTGAALLAACVSGFGTCPPLRPMRVGYGAGTRDIGAPNVCQLLVGEPVEPFPLRAEAVALLETNVDHLSAESVAVTISALLAQGALDAWATPITMKKGRPALLLSVLVGDKAAEWAQRLSALTGSLGVRQMQVERFVAEREIRSIETPWGPVRVKVGAGRMRPEADDVARIAAEISQPFAEVERELARLAQEQLHH